MSFSAAQAVHILSVGRRGISLRGSGATPLQIARRRRYLSAAAFFAGLLWLAPQAYGAIALEPRVGFRGVFQLGRPFPIEVEVQNMGRPVDGLLELQVWKGGATKGGPAYPVVYRRELYLGAQARRSVQFTVDPDFISRPVTVVFSGPGTKVERELDLRRHFSPAPVLLLVSERGAPPLSLAATLQHRLVSVALNELPADPRALLGVSHLVVYDQSLRDIGRAQIAAIEVWLSAGGKMVILGSLNYALYQESAMSRFLPVRVAGAKRINFAPSGAKRAPAVADAWVQISAVTSGDLVAEADGIPLIVEASRGRGKITYLALDIGRPPLSDWEGLPKLVQDLLAPASFAEPALRSEWNDSIFAQLVASPSFIARYVPALALFIALALYLCGVALIGWLWQRKRYAPRRLMLILVGLVSAAAAAGHGHFNRGGNIPDGVLLSSTVVESSADGFVDAQSNLALFSTQVRTYDLQLERGWMELTPVSTRFREDITPVVVRQDGGGATRYQVPLREWDYRLFRLRSVDRFPLRADFEVQGDKLLMKVDNRSAHDLVDCWLLLPGQKFNLGAIASGASWSRTFPLANPKGLEARAYGRGEPVNFREISFTDKTRDILFHSSFFPRDQAAVWGAGGVFFGWVKDPALRVLHDDPKIQAQGYALFRALVPLGGGDEE